MITGAENAAKYKTLLYLGSSASAEFIADVGLCPFEAVKVRVQTQPGFAKGLADGMPKLIASDGFVGTSDSLHDDEVCDVREHGGGPLQVRGAGAEV
jgi:hypothetical protein